MNTSETNRKLLSPEDVRHIARLAALRIDEDEVETMRNQLSDILAHFQTLAELDTEGVSPTGHTTDAHSVMRDDEEMPALKREQMLSNAPFVDGEFVRVRPVIE
jgi:aspartyl-tRNA(Asn)/glutamyl-tRNA(Gln) amidotransferase subunit C